jgi:chaperonin GroES
MPISTLAGLPGSSAGEVHEQRVPRRFVVWAGVLSMAAAILYALLRSRRRATDDPARQRHEERPCHHATLISTKERWRTNVRAVASNARIHVNLESRSMNIKPLHDRIIIQRLEEGEQKVGGIIIPDTAKEKPQQGKVIAAGSGKTTDDGKRVPLDVTAGDTILFGKYSGQEIKFDGEEYLIMKEDEVLAIIEGGTNHETKKRK